MLIVGSRLSYRVPAVPRGTDAGRRSAARSPRSAFVLAGGRSQPVCLMSGCLCGAREVASRQGQSRRRLVPRRTWAERMRVTGGGYRQVPLPDMRNAIAVACFVKLTGSAPAGSHLQGLRSPGGDVGVVEGDLLTCCEPQPRVGRQASAATSTSGALPARNRPVKLSRGDGSPGRGPAGSPSRRYRGVDRIFLVQQPVFPEPALLDVLPAWPVAEAGNAGTASGGKVQGHSAGAAARAAGGRLTRLDGAPRHDAAAPGRMGDRNPAGLGLR